jgi:hypothetical protein
VTALEISATRGGRGEAGDGRHLGPKKQAALHGAFADRVLAFTKNPPHAKARGCFGEATGMSEARLFRGCVVDNAIREPEEPAEADYGAVKRQVPQSLFPGQQVMEEERGASLGKMLGTREARVLVVEAVGSRIRSERIELVLPGLSQGRSGTDEQACRKPTIH